METSFTPRTLNPSFTVWHEWIDLMNWYLCRCIRVPAREKPTYWRTTPGQNYLPVSVNCVRLLLVSQTPCWAHILSWLAPSPRHLSVAHTVPSSTAARLVVSSVKGCILPSLRKHLYRVDLSTVFAEIHNSALCDSGWSLSVCFYLRLRWFSTLGRSIQNLLNWPTASRPPWLQLWSAVLLQSSVQMAQQLRLWW